MKKIRITESEIAAVAAQLKEIAPYITARVTAGSEWSNPLAVKIIDCVFSIRTNYYKVLKPRLEIFKNKHPDTQRIVDLASLMASYETPYTFVKKELNYNSERKARILQEVVKFACQIVQETPNVQEEKVVKQWAIQAKPQDYQKLKIKGFALASFQYLRMLFGADTTKPDVHIKRFISRILSREVSDIDSLFLLETASKRVGLSTQAVDYFIWDKAARGTGTSPDIGTHIVRLAPDVAAAFPTEEAVNQALRSVLKERSEER